MRSLQVVLVSWETQPMFFFKIITGSLNKLTADWAVSASGWLIKADSSWPARIIKTFPISDSISSLHCCCCSWWVYLSTLYTSSVSLPELAGWLKKLLLLLIVFVPATLLPTTPPCWVCSCVESSQRRRCPPCSGTGSSPGGCCRHRRFRCDLRRYCSAHK